MDNSKPAKKQPTTRTQLLLLTALTIACLLPFIGKAFNIDDPLFVWVAQHIRTHPFDPYGFHVNWYSTSMLMSDVTKNPPLAAYYLALASYVVGFSEAGLHLFLIVPAVAMVLGTYRLARRFCTEPILAALAALFAPVFLVSATSVMCDVMMLAFWVWAMVLWVEGLDEQDQKKLVISALLIAACALTKYFGMALIPLLLIYSLAKKKSDAWRAVYLAVPVAFLVAYEFITKAQYGRGLLSDAAAYSRAIARIPDHNLAQKLLTGLGFTGGCFLVLLFFAPLLWSKRGIIAGVLFAAAAAFGLSHINSVGHIQLRVDSRPQWSMIIHFSIYLTLALSLIALLISDFLKHRDADSALLVAWVGAALVFAVLINWSINGRSLLPVVPAVGIVIARRLGARRKTPSDGAWRWWTAALAAGAIASLWITWCDCALANTDRAMAEKICTKYANGSATVWSQGHWGFQYYMQKLGAYQIDFDCASFANRDIIVVPGNNCNTVEPPPEAFKLVEVISANLPGGISLMGTDAHAGFYADSWGSLPFVFGPTSPQRCAIYWVLATKNRAP